MAGQSSAPPMMINAKTTESVYILHYSWSPYWCEDKIIMQFCSININNYDFFVRLILLIYWCLVLFVALYLDFYKKLITYVNK